MGAKKKEGTPWNLAVAAIYPVEVDISPVSWLFSKAPVYFAFNFE